MSNTNENEKDTKYNGWANYETWHYVLVQDQTNKYNETMNYITELIQDNPTMSRDELKYELANTLKEVHEEKAYDVQDILEKYAEHDDDINIFIQAVINNPQEIKWDEVSETWLRRYEENYNLKIGAK